MLENLLIVLVAAVVVVPIFQRFRWSPVLGYLVAGIAIGPHALSLVDDVEHIHTLAEFGIVFLLFVIGLELSVERLRQLRSFVFGLGTAQFLITAAIIALIANAVGLAPDAAMIAGAALALSSTAVVAQLLAERGELELPFGRAAFSVLLFQDLAAVPLLALLPMLTGREASVISVVGLALLKAALALVIIVALGRLLMRPGLRIVAQARSTELFAATALLVALGTAWISQQFGMSMALGAFLAGVLLAETEYRHQIEADIRPYRAIFLSLFFTSVGMTINLNIIVANAPLLAALVVGVILLKAAVTAGLALAFRLPAHQASRIGLVLANGGEFSFVLFTLAAANKIIPSSAAQILVLTIAITMALAPAMAALAQRVGQALERRDAAADLPDDEKDGDHVIIAGFGRVGMIVARMLAADDVPVVALDLDPARVAAGRKRGFRVFYGDAGHANVLHAAGIGQARAAVITLDHPGTAERAVAMLRREFPDLQIFVRARDLSHRDVLERTGANEVVPEVIEASLQLGGAVLRGLGAPVDETADLIEEFRADDYARLRDVSASVPPDKTDQKSKSA
jgi:monovalent cation:H+ antiporter-2, CPA2 family